jgi:hypothetical protein
MIVSPDSKNGRRCSIVSSVGVPAGTLSQTARGFVSFFARSAKSFAPIAPSLASVATDSCFSFSRRDYFYFEKKLHLKEQLPVGAFLVDGFQPCGNGSAG